MAGKREAQRENAIDLMCQVAIQAIGQGRIHRHDVGRGR